jgi:hypothetical protein
VAIVLAEFAVARQARIIPAGPRGANHDTRALHAKTNLRARRGDIDFEFSDDGKDREDDDGPKPEGRKGLISTFITPKNIAAINDPGEASIRREGAHQSGICHHASWR